MPRFFAGAAIPACSRRLHAPGVCPLRRLSAPGFRMLRSCLFRRLRAPGVCVLRICRLPGFACSALVCSGVCLFRRLSVPAFACSGVCMFRCLSAPAFCRSPSGARPFPPPGLHEKRRAARRSPFPVCPSRTDARRCVGVVSRPRRRSGSPRPSAAWARTTSSSEA